MPLSRRQIVLSSESSQQLQQTISTSTAAPAVFDQVITAHLSDCIFQLGQIAKYSAEIFEDLSQMSSEAVGRITKLTSRLQNVEQQLPQAAKACNDSLRTFKWKTERVGWKKRNRIVEDSQLFTKQSTNPSLQKVYDSIPPVPPLHLLDSNRDDGQPCMKLYSYPQFFFDEWCRKREQEEKDLAEGKRKKKDKDVNLIKSEVNRPKKVMEVSVKKYDSEGRLIEEKKNPAAASQESEQQQDDFAPPPPMPPQQQQQQQQHQVQNGDSFMPPPPPPAVNPASVRAKPPGTAPPPPKTQAPSKKNLPPPSDLPPPPPPPPQTQDGFGGSQQSLNAPTGAPPPVPVFDDGSAPPPPPPPPMPLPPSDMMGDAVDETFDDIPPPTDLSFGFDDTPSTFKYESASHWTDETDENGQNFESSGNAEESNAYDENVDPNYTMSFELSVPPPPPMDGLEMPPPPSDEVDAYNDNVPLPEDGSLTFVPVAPSKSSGPPPPPPPPGGGPPPPAPIAAFVPPAPKAPPPPGDDQMVAPTKVFDPRMDLMSQIKLGGAKALKKVEIVAKPATPQPVKGNDVASILMRRMALEMSDDDDDDNDDDDNDDWD